MQRRASSAALRCAGKGALVAAGCCHSLFVQAGEAYAWGHNDFGELGDGSITRRATPVHVLSDVASVAAGHLHSVFVKSNGDAWVSGWNGDNGYGGLGYSTTDRHTPVRVLSEVAMAAGGWRHPRNGRRCASQLELPLELPARRWT